MGQLHSPKLLLAALLIALFSVVTVSAFSDAQARPSGAVMDERSAEYGLISGDEDGAFQPDDSAETVHNPAYAAASGETADDGGASIDSGETTHDPGRTADSDETADSSKTSIDPGETVRNPAYAAASGETADDGGMSIDSGETTHDPGRAAASDETADDGGMSIESGETVRNPEYVADSDETADSGKTSIDPGETVRNPEYAAKVKARSFADPGETTHDPGRTADSGATPAADSDEALYAPERFAPSADSGETTDSGKTTDSGETTDNGKTTDSGKTAYDYGVTYDPGETTHDPGRTVGSDKTADSGKTSIDPGETTDPGVTENPENQLPTPKPSTPAVTENPENQLPTDIAPYIPVNPNYGTLPNKPVSQLTVRDVYAPGKTTGQYFTFEGRRIPIYQGVPARNVYSGEFVWREGRRLRYVGNRYNAWFGVDVSAYQNRDRANQTINWAAAKADGVQFAMVRVGLRGTSTGILHEDAYYARNIDGAMAQGIQTGAYIFAQAKTIAEAIEEADFVIARLRGHKINGPVSYDWEMKDSSYRVYGTSPEMATACAVAFCKRVAAAGYTPMVYNSRYVAYVKYDQGALAPYMMWYPQYPASSTPAPYPNLYYQMDYWQFTDSAVVEGIGRKIDANIWFRPKS